MTFKFLQPEQVKSVAVLTVKRGHSATGKCKNKNTLVGTTIVNNRPLSFYILFSEQPHSNLLIHHVDHRVVGG